MDKTFLYDAVEKAADVLTALSDRIWEYAELSLEEFQSAAAYCDLLEAQGFQVEREVYGVKTAFTGSFGQGKPVIGILGEFDALSGLSQAPGVAEKQPLTAGGCGHGCGHNLLGAAALGAAIAVKEAIEAGKLTGTVVFYGCPGEEGCAGKAFMARDGAFRDLDAAITWHPGDVNEVSTGSNAASLQMIFSFTGIAAHAAGNPEQGRSALDAAELMNHGVQYLREHMEAKCSVHYSYLDAGGRSPNVVQPTAKLCYMVRGENVTKAKALLERVKKIAQGAAMMTETQVSWHQVDGTASTLSNRVLEEVLQENLSCAPLPAYSQADWDFAEALKKTCPAGDLPGTLGPQAAEKRAFVEKMTDSGSRALNDFVMPYVPSDNFERGSTDVGDVSWLTPTAQMNAVTWVSGCPGHSWQVVSMGKSGIAHKGMLYAAKALAGAAADLMETPALLAKARSEFEKEAAAGYDCPIGPEVVPTAQV
ncbi:MAG: amidohydrolase [Eubacteriales bacterium]|nr:amidohydrolase [Eubacteriales bacterium]